MVTWLIERGTGSQVEYLATDTYEGVSGWTDNPYEAVRLCRGIDAVMLISVIGDTDCKATDHIFED